MNLQFYLEKLYSSENFNKFKEENPKAYLCSGFFVIDKEGKDNQIHFDYFIPESKEMISFNLKEGVEKKHIEILDKSWIPEISDESIDFNFEEIENLIVKKMEEENIKNKLQKILISLQKSDEEILLICTVFISMLGMLKVKIGLKAMKITEFERKSLMNILKIKKKENVK